MFLEILNKDGKKKQYTTLGWSKVQYWNVPLFYLWVKELKFTLIVLSLEAVYMTPMSEVTRICNTDMLWPENLWTATARSRGLVV